jgi:hypothetical protein
MVSLCSTSYDSSYTLRHYALIEINPFPNQTFYPEIRDSGPLRRRLVKPQPRSNVYVTGASRAPLALLAACRREE